jgi:hypothetical protein
VTGRRLDEEAAATAAEPDRSVPDEALRDPRHDGLLALQQLAGNQAVARLVEGRMMARAPVDAPPRPLFGTLEPEVPPPGPAKPVPPPFDPTVGDEVGGYMTPQEHYTREDRNELNNRVTERRMEHNENVLSFLGTYSQALIELWSRHLTGEMAKAAKYKPLDWWEKVAKFAVEEALIAVFTGGAGLVIKAMAKHAVHLMVEKAVTFGVVQLGHGAEYDYTGISGIPGEVAKKKSELDAKTAQIGQMVKAVHTDMKGALDIPWNEYGEWLFTASDAEVRRFRLPEIFPRVDEDLVRTGVAGALVSVISDPDQKVDDTKDLDNRVVASLAIGEGHAVHNIRTEIRASSAGLMTQLGERPVRTMGPIPLHITVGGGSDAQAAKELLEALSRATERVSHENEPELRPSDVFRFLATLPAREASLVITRAIDGPDGARPVAAGLATSGGGLAEYLWLYRWARGNDDLTDLAETIAADLDATALSPEDAADEVFAHLEHWAPIGVQRLVDEYVGDLRPLLPQKWFEMEE